MGPFDSGRSIAYKDGLLKRFGALWVRVAGRDLVSGDPRPAGGRLGRVGGVPMLFGFPSFFDNLVVEDGI
jgi:hypothetical protein